MFRETFPTQFFGQRYSCDGLSLQSVDAEELDAQLADNTLDPFTQHEELDSEHENTKMHLGYLISFLL